MTQRRAPDENSSRHSQSSSVHFGNSPFGLKHPKCLTLGLNRLPKFSNGTALKAFPNPARPWSGPTPCTRRLRTRKRWVQAKLLGTRLGLRKRPAGRTRMSEAAGRVCAVERTWPLTRTLSQRERDWWTKIILWGQKFRSGRERDVQKNSKVLHLS